MTATVVHATSFALMTGARQIGAQEHSIRSSSLLQAAGRRPCCSRFSERLTGRSRHNSRGHAAYCGANGPPDWTGHRRADARTEYATHHPTQKTANNHPEVRLRRSVWIDARVGRSIHCLSQWILGRRPSVDWGTGSIHGLSQRILDGRPPETGA
jgi:hypothetical protein